MSEPSEPDLTETGEHPTFEELLARHYEVEPRMPVVAEFAALTDRGKVRETNEDQYLVVRRRRGREVLLSSLPVELLPKAEQVAHTLAVADGMGGHAFGELASLLALRTGWDLGGGEVKWPVKMNEREADELHQKAILFYRLIHDQLRDAGRERPRLAGMGTTLTIAYTFGPELFILHAGDSRAYLARGGTLQRLTRDHTLAQTLLDAGAITRGSPEERRSRHVLTNCLGGPAVGVEVDFGHHRLLDGDRVLLCTDGLTDVVDDVEIAAILDRERPLDELSRALLDLALERGGKDNVTVILGRYRFPAVADELPDVWPPLAASPRD